MSLTAIARAVPGTLSQAIEVNGRHHLFTDEPARLGGDDSGPSPHELLPAALAGCIATQITMYARAKDWELGAVAVSVDYDHRSTPRRFRVDVQVGGDVPIERLVRLEAIAAACPVRKALEGGAEFVERVEAAPPEERAA